MMIILMIFVMTKLMEIELVITDIVNDIEQIYAIVDNHRFDIGSKLKDIAHIINDSLDSYDYNVVADDNSTNEINDDLLL